eukprot:jgi/Ulvmu1/547/UM001_0555.1
MWLSRTRHLLSAYANHAAVPDMDMAYVFILGGPGAGKGTQCKLLVKEFGFQHLSAGELLRNFIARGGPQAEHLSDIINNQGKIVPAHVTVRLLMEAMQQSEGPACLIDGFPRNMENLQAWEAAVPRSCESVLNYSAPEGVLCQRLLNRAGAGRSDDNMQTIQRRLQTFEEATKPVLSHFQAIGKVHTINAAAGVDEVYQATRQHFIKLLDNSSPARGQPAG